MEIISDQMLKTKYAVLNIADIEAIIRSVKICRLGMVDGEYAYIVPLNFGYDKGVLYFHMGSKGQKIDLLKANPRVTFEMDIEHSLKESENACDWNMFYQSVMGKGIASFVEELEQKKHALNIIMKQYLKKDWTFPAEKVAITTILMVEIESISARSNFKQENS